ncbi:peptidoglycan-binding domain-containing protein [Streptomyces sp. MS19]|uniref:peptidoglycan-binding domain-containing protein n=1 Tax=Streptomyces sp. MS19 TaxID=3385972 RepID=UPI0039A19FF5
MSLRTKAAAAAVALALGGSVAVSATPASANASGGVVHGTGVAWDDWNDEGPISQSSYAHSNVAAMWQAILWADGQLSSTAAIDCRFGPATAAATRTWQADHGTASDGIVGSDTLARASGQLSGTPGSGNRISYEGRASGRYVTFTRTDDGRWGMYVGNDLRTLWYTEATFSACA